MKPFLTPKQVADLLSLNYRTILNWIILGQLPAYKIGNQYRVDESDLWDMIKSTRYEAPKWLR